MTKINFPKLSKEKLNERLQHPEGIARIIIDTDAANALDAPCNQSTFSQIYDYCWNKHLITISTIRYFHLGEV